MKTKIKKLSINLDKLDQKLLNELIKQTGKSEEDIIKLALYVLKDKLDDKEKSVETKIQFVPYFYPIYPYYSPYYPTVKPIETTPTWYPDWYDENIPQITYTSPFYTTTSTSSLTINGVINES